MKIAVILIGLFVAALGGALLYYLVKIVKDKEKKP